MKKATFNYKKSEDSIESRELLNPSFVKESYNKFTELDNKNVNYLTGIEIDKNSLTEQQIKDYEEALKDYFDLAVPTIEQFLLENNLDPKKINIKTFKKEKISNLMIYD
jgi:hypothetical protein